MKELYEALKAIVNYAYTPGKDISLYSGMIDNAEAALLAYEAPQGAGEIQFKDMPESLAIEIGVLAYGFPALVKDAPIYKYQPYDASMYEDAQELISVKFDAVIFGKTSYPVIVNIFPSCDVTIRFQDDSGNRSLGVINQREIQKKITDWLYKPSTPQAGEEVFDPSGIGCSDNCMEYGSCDGSCSSKLSTPAGDDNHTVSDIADYVRKKLIEMQDRHNTDFNRMVKKNDDLRAEIALLKLELSDYKERVPEGVSKNAEKIHQLQKEIALWKQTPNDEKLYTQKEVDAFTNAFKKEYIHKDEYNKLWKALAESQQKQTPSGPSDSPSGQWTDGDMKKAYQEGWQQSYLYHRQRDASYIPSPFDKWLEEYSKPNKPLP